MLNSTGLLLIPPVSGARRLLEFQTCRVNGYLSEVECQQLSAYVGLN